MVLPHTRSNGMRHSSFLENLSQNAGPTNALRRVRKRPMLFESRILQHRLQRVEPRSKSIPAFLNLPPLAFIA
jgi:hypothetical protein